MASKPKATRKPNAALMKKLQPSEKLASVIGPDPISRGQAMKKIWEYFKANKLNHGREIDADEKLKPIVVIDGQSVDRINMFQVGKIVSQNLK